MIDTSRIIELIYWIWLILWVDDLLNDWLVNHRIFADTQPMQPHLEFTQTTDSYQMFANSEILEYLNIGQFSLFPHAIFVN